MTRPRLVLSLAALPTLLGCLTLFPAPTPMQSVLNSLPGPAKAHCLILLLPGRGDSAEDFSKKGVVEMLRSRQLSADIVSANATLGYYLRGTMATRLEEDVVTPQRLRAYDHVFVFGISMGGMGALWLSREQPALATEVFLMSPYLGDDDVSKQIRKSGGLARWTPPARVSKLNEDNYQREIWRWLQAVLAGKEKGPALLLGFGDRDRGMASLETLAQALPADHVLRAPGPHDWPTWRKLLGEYLDRGAMERACGSPEAGG